MARVAYRRAGHHPALPCRPCPAVLVGVYLSAMGVITLIALLLSRETRDLEYTANVS